MAPTSAPDGPTPATRRRRQVRILRRLPADRPRPRGRPARDRRAVRHRRVPGGDLAPLGRTRSTSCSSRARSARTSSSRSCSACAARRRPWSRSAPARPPAASRPSATGPTTGRGRRPSTRSPELVDSLATATPVADHVVVDAELRGCPIDPRPAAGAPDRARRRAPAAAARRIRLRRVQAARRDLRRRRAGHRLSRTGDPDRLRRALSGLRTRLLRLLRTARRRQRRPASIAECAPASTTRRRGARSPASRPGRSRSGRSSTPTAARPGADPADGDACGGPAGRPAMTTTRARRPNAPSRSRSRA